MSTPRERINGWGADLDLKNRPAYPKEKPSNVQHAYGNVRQEQQVSDYPVQQSIEHAHLTPVYGTSCPPKGLSGKLRKTAFKYSEAELAHWMLLMLADRVDVYESLVTDLGRGKVPKPRERGWNVRIRDRNPEKAPRKPVYLAIGAVGIVAAAVLMARLARED
jgi:hypothetical protein